MNRNLKNFLIDRYEAAELCDILPITIEDFIERFEDLIEENEDEIADLAGFNEDEDDE